MVHLRVWFHLVCWDSLLTMFGRTATIRGMKACLNCTNEVSDKAEFCSDRCRMAYRRRTKKGAQPEQNDPEHTTRTLDFTPTRTDRLFEDSKPNYYRFSDEVKNETCVACDKNFRTRLSLLRYCSPACQKASLRTAL